MEEFCPGYRKAQHDFMEKRTAFSNCSGLDLNLLHCAAPQTVCFWIAFIREKGLGFRGLRFEGLRTGSERVLGFGFRGSGCLGVFGCLEFKV